jgi:Holliday junction DNA helicase RuvA
MIGYIYGKVMDIGQGTLLIENNGIGYEVSVSTTAFERMTREKQGGIYTYLQVREDGISLFGFDSLAEKSMFLKLISVSGVGPKMGIGILSGMSLQDLAMTIATSDVKTLSKIKGCGKKTAERIIVELRENVSSLDLGSLPAVAPSVGADGDAVIALMSLGFTRSESEKAISVARTQGAGTIEEIIAIALKNLAK